MNHMKTNRNVWSYLFRPFQFIAGIKSLLLGIITLLILSLLGHLSHTYFDGVLDVHYVCTDAPSTLLTHVIWIFGSWIIAVIIMYLTALILAGRSVRFIDMAGTLAMAKIPMIGAALWGFIPIIHICIGNPVDLQLMMNEILVPTLLALPSLIFLIWSIVLMYNAFSISGNLKGTKGVLSFIATLLISELLSKIVIVIFLKMIN